MRRIHARPRIRNGRIWRIRRVLCSPKLQHRIRTGSDIQRPDIRLQQHLEHCARIHCPNDSQQRLFHIFIRQQHIYIRLVIKFGQKLPSMLRIRKMQNMQRQRTIFRHLHQQIYKMPQLHKRSLHIVRRKRKEIVSNLIKTI